MCRGAKQKVVPRTFCILEAMKKLIPYLLPVVLMSTMSACKSSVEGEVYVFFREPWSRDAYDLREKFGDTLDVELMGKESRLLISYELPEGISTIATEEGDTIFSGLVNRYKGLYFFNRKFSQGYWIAAVSINREFIAGIGKDALHDQMKAIQQSMEDNQMGDLIDGSDERGTYLKTEKGRLLPVYLEILDKSERYHYKDGYTIRLETDEAFLN